MSPKTSVGYLAIVFLLGMPFFSCTATEENSLSTIQSDYITDAEEAYGIAYKAYLFFYPVVENLRCLSLSMGYPNRPEHTAFNSFHHNDRALAPNDYVLYSTVWLDLRQEAKVLTVPVIKDRYYSVQIVDGYTHNVEIISDRTTYMTRRGGRFIIAGPNYCSKPTSCYRPYDDVYCTEGDYALVIVRIQYYSKEDIDYKVKLLQQHFEVERLSTYCHIHGPYLYPAPVLDIHISKNYYDELTFFEYANYAMLNLTIHRTEVSWFEDFAKIGIVPGGPYPPRGLEQSVQEAIEKAIRDAIIAIDKEVAHPANGVYHEGWQTVLKTPWYGSRDVLQGRYLDRAAGVRAGIYGLDKEEAYYAVTRLTSSGSYLDARYGKSYYIIFEKGHTPPVYGLGPKSYKTYYDAPTGYWSITLHDDWTGGYVDKADRHSIGSREWDKLCRYEDGSTIIVIQTEEPKEPAYKTNWLPAPYGKFYLIARFYHPMEAAYKQSYLPPGVHEGYPPYPPTYCPYYDHSKKPHY